MAVVTLVTELPGYDIWWVGVGVEWVVKVRAQILFARKLDFKDFLPKEPQNFRVFCVLIYNLLPLLWLKTLRK